MPADAAELSAIEASLRQLTERIASIADRRDADPDDPITTGLFETERSLTTALRQLERARRRLG